MVAKVVTVAFEGVEAKRVDVEVQTTSGVVAFVVVGLGDKAVAESRERVRAAFSGLGLALPAKRLIVNLAPADLPKEGSHYDLPIALGLMGVMGILPPDALNGWMAFGELGLDGQIAPTAGALPAAVAASSFGLGLICPEASGPEAAWAGDVRLLAPRSLISLLNHFRGTQVLGAPKPGPVLDSLTAPDLRDVKGQEQAKRALEIAAAGGHNLLRSRWFAWLAEPQRRSVVERIAQPKLGRLSAADHAPQLPAYLHQRDHALGWKQPAKRDSSPCPTTCTVGVGSPLTGEEIVRRHGSGCGLDLGRRRTPRHYWPGLQAWWRDDPQCSHRRVAA